MHNKKISDKAVRYFIYKLFKKLIFKGLIFIILLQSLSQTTFSEKKDF